MNRPIASHSRLSEEAKLRQHQDVLEISALMAEYTAKIRDMQKEQNAYRYRMQWFTAVAVVADVVFTLQTAHDVATHPIHKTIGLVFGLLLSLLIIIVPMAMIYRVETHRIDRLNAEMRLLIDQLSPVITTASEIEEFSSLSSIERLQLRLRLTEAEGVLRLGLYRPFLGIGPVGSIRPAKSKKAPDTAAQSTSKRSSMSEEKWVQKTTTQETPERYINITR